MIEREIYYDGMLVVTRFSGHITVDELINSAHWMIDNFDVLIKPGFSQLFDAHDADTHAITEEDIHRIAHINLHHGKKRGGFTMAILAVKPYPVTLARLHKLLSAAANTKVEIFDDAGSAYKWLGYKNPAA